MRTPHSLFRHSHWLAIGVAAILATGCATMPGKRPTVLTGAQEVPSVATRASGHADISVDSFKCPSAASSNNCPTIVGVVTATGMNGTVAEIRDGAPGQNGALIVTLDKVRDNMWQVPSGTTLTDAQYRDYWADRLYVNVDSSMHKDGEIRAQLKP